MKDIVIIGAGTSGLTAAKFVAKHTENYLLIDHGPLGTTCARVGCMPSKALIHSAELFYLRKIFASHGISDVEMLEIDISKTLARVRQLRDYFVNSVVQSMQKLKFIKGVAKFIDSNTVEVNGEKISAKTFIIASGSSPAFESKFDNIKENLLDTDSLFEQENLPKTMASFGLGAIGLEMAQALSRFGINVTAIGRSNKIGGISDSRVSEAAFEILSEEFPIWFNSTPEIKMNNGKVEIDDYDHVPLTVDKVLSCMGRKQNINSLGLETTLAEFDENGRSIVDKDTLKIKGTNLYLVGDAKGDHNVLHEAADEGNFAAMHALGKTQDVYNKKIFFRIIFTKPNIAIVGTPFKELNKDNILIGEVDYSDQGRARTDDKNQGLLRIYADKDSKQILGSEMIAPDGEHLGHLLALAIQEKLTAEQLLRLPFYHPTLEEGLRTALKNLR